MEGVRTYVDEYYNLGDDDVVSDNGLLFGDISIKDPTDANSEVKPPLLYFRYL